MNACSVTPEWLMELMGIVPGNECKEGNEILARGQEFILRHNILRQKRLASEAQSQTSDIFDFKWHKRDTFESHSMQRIVTDWLYERYGDPDTAVWWRGVESETIVLDAGCGGAHTALALFGDRLSSVRYLGVDISNAVEIANQRCLEAGIKAAFLQADITDLPFAEDCVDIIYSEGVLHHTDSTESAINALSRHLKPNGWFLFYVYRKKGPIREFTDDYIREKLQGMDPAHAWEALKPLTALGESLGALNAEIEIPQTIELLDIPAGRMSVQRLFYWHVLKAFYRPELSLEEMNHINFDWFAPKNAHRQTIEDVRRWCSDAGLVIHRERVEDAGITIIARKAAIDHSA